MPRTLRPLLLLTVAALLLPGHGLAIPDQYQGDTGIYSGLPTTADTPNVLIIIDNSRATLEKAPGQPYSSGQVYPKSTDPKKQYEPWNIYSIDNQGNVANLPVLKNTDVSLENLKCDLNNDVIRRTLLLRGTYTGAGSDDFPNLKGGECDTASNGQVYILGNYLNYTLTETKLGVICPDADADGKCDLDPKCSAPSPIVSNKITTQTCKKYEKDGVTCQLYNPPVIQTVYFQLKEGPPHVSSDSDKPGVGANWQNLWTQLPLGSTYTAAAWASGTRYLHPLYPDPAVDGYECKIEEAPEAKLGLTQREIMYKALEQAIGGALGSVRFAAMSYGTNNQGGSLLYPMTDLSKGACTDADPDCKVSAPVCDPKDPNFVSGNESLEFCKFLASLPGVRKDPDATGPFTTCADFTGGGDDKGGCVSSNTARPQAEALMDAGYYYGAQYTSFTNKTRIADSVKSICDMNHVILLTNGFSNGEGQSQNFNAIGDYNTEPAWSDETVYGLGSHWLDDVAKYLKDKNKVTTHVVLAFQENDPLLELAADVGEGGYYQAYSAEQLAAALTNALNKIISEKNTSFVAPVVPASTTNRTVSSNKVYLGLFRPQETGMWHGNIKKYSLDTSGDALKKNRLLAADGSVATDASGKFDDDKISYWSLKEGETLIPAAGPDININEPDTNKPRGDGGQVDAGGIGGVLLRRIEALAAAVQSQATWTPSGVDWRKIYTVLEKETSKVESMNPDLTATQNLFAPENAYITPETLGVGTSGDELSEAKKRDLIRQIHGFASNLTETFSEAKARSWVFGDILHSRPLVFNYSTYGPTHETLCTPGVDGKYNSSVIYVGANDGMLHAFNDCDGSERWAFIPPDFLDRLKYYDTPLEPGAHQTYVDAPPSAFVHDADADGVVDAADGDKVVLIFGMRRGGGVANLKDPGSRGAYYAVDVTDPDKPTGLWRFGGGASSSNPELGETWSQPRIAKVLVQGADGQADPDQFKVVAFIAGGYDTNEDLRYGNTASFQCDSSNADVLPCSNTNRGERGGTVDGSGSPATSPGSVAPDDRLGARGRGLYAVEVATMTRSGGKFEPTLSDGKSYWEYTAAKDGNLDYPITSDLTVLDMNGDALTDRIYAGDTGGNLWRFDLSDPDKSKWSGEIIFRSNSGFTCEYGVNETCTPTADNSTGRKIFYRPVVVNIGVPHIYFGTGDREHPLNRAVTDRMYCVVDWGQTAAMNIDESKLVDVTENKLQDPAADPKVTQAIEAMLYSKPVPKVDLDDSANADLRYGWYIRLDGKDRNSGGDPGEKVLAPPTVFNGQVFYSTYQLKTGLSAGCDPGNLGVSRLYQLNYKTGESVLNFCNGVYSDCNNDGTTVTNERSVGGESGEVLARVDRVRTLGEGIPSGIVTMLDASGKVTLLISSSDKVEASGLPDVKLITPVYWMQW